MKAGIWASVTALAFTGAAHAQESPPDRRGIDFDGVYVGFTVGMQNIIGGALVNGVDVIAQERRPTIDFFVGWRTTFDNGFVIGAEAGIGLEDGDMSLVNSQGRADWSNNSHWRYGGLIGYRAGDGPLLFAYLNETKRDFDVRLQNNFGVATQHDVQGLLRYGVGAEFNVGGPFNLRATAGSSRADFGDRPTSREPDHPIEVEVGAIYQF